MHETIASLKTKTYLVKYLIGVNLLSFGFMLTNALLNHDATGLDGKISFYYSANIMRLGNGILHTLLFDGYQLPYFEIGVGLIVNIVSGILLVEILRIKNKVNAFIVASIFCIAPIWSLLFTYVFMSEAYSFMYLFSFVFILLLREHGKFKYISIAVAILLSSFAISCYQAIVMYMITLIMGLFIIELINGKKELKIVIVQYVKLSSIYVFSIVLYYVATKTLLACVGIKTSTYNGANQFFNLSDFSHFIKVSVSYYVMADFYKSIFNHMAFIILFICVLICVIISKIKFFNKLVSMISLFLWLFTPNLILLFHKVPYEEIMFGSYFLLDSLLFLMFIRINKIKFLKVLAIASMFIVIFNYAKANNFYQYYSYKNNQKRNYIYNSVVDKALELAYKDGKYKRYKLYLVRNIKGLTCKEGRTFKFKDFIKPYDISSSYCRFSLSNVQVPSAINTDYILKMRDVDLVYIPDIAKGYSSYSQQFSKLFKQGEFFPSPYSYILKKDSIYINMQEQSVERE